MTDNRKAWETYRRDLAIYRACSEGDKALSSGNITLAIDAYESAARFGSNYARAKLGEIYDDIMIPPDPRKAVYWYKAGVKSGDGSFAWDLAMHYSALGVRRWYDHWLQIAEIMREPRATYEINHQKWWLKHNPSA